MELLIAALAICALVFALMAWGGWDGRLLYLAVIFLAIIVLIGVITPFVHDRGASLGGAVLGYITV